MIVREARHKDFRHMTFKETEVAGLVEIEQEIIAAIGNSGSNARTLVAEGPGKTVVGIFGVTILRPGVGHAWSLLGEDFRAHARETTDTIRDLIEDVQKRERLRRIDMTCRAEPARFENWGIRLGFEREGLLRCYGPDNEDYLVMSRVWT